MEIHITKERGRVPVTVLHLNGNLDAMSYEVLEASARTQMEEGVQDMVIDLKQVPYMSSAGLRALNTIYRSLHHAASAADSSEVNKSISAGTYKSPHLKLAAPSKRVAEAIKMAGFDMFLDIKPDLESAIAAF